jgi:hypothetical protein
LWRYVLEIMDTLLVITRNMHISVLHLLQFSLVCTGDMIPAQVPLTDPHRQRLKDDRLWIRELQRARLFNLKQLHCPCSQCKGRRRFKLATVREHLIRNGRDSEFRIWRGPGNRDSSDDKWEQVQSTPDQACRERLDP